MIETRRDKQKQRNPNCGNSRGQREINGHTMMVTKKEGKEHEETDRHRRTIQHDPRTDIDGH